MDFVIVESDQIDPATRVDLRDLWRRTFGDRFSDDDADHAYGGVHVLARDGDRLVGHASAEPRRIRFGDQPWRTVGYVEAVATDPDRQGEGIGRRTHGGLMVLRLAPSFLPDLSVPVTCEDRPGDAWWDRSTPGAAADGERAVMPR